MQAYLINLPEATERLAHMRETLGRIGMPFVRFNALDPERAARHPAFPLVQPLKPRPWSPGELACLLSHYEVWRLIAEGVDAFGMVLEDDLVVDPRLRNIRDGSVQIPPEADVLKLETGHQTVTLSRRAIPAQPGLVWRRLLSVHDGAGAYVLARAAARRLVANPAALDAPADDLLFTRNLRVYQLLPALAIQSVNLPIADQSAHLDSGLEGQRREAWESVPSQTPAKPALAQRLRERCRDIFAFRAVVPFG